jgi:hypothetical protein
MSAASDQEKNTRQGQNPLIFLHFRPGDFFSGCGGLKYFVFSVEVSGTNEDGSCGKCPDDTV